MQIWSAWGLMDQGVTRLSADHNELNYSRLREGWKKEWLGYKWDQYFIAPDDSVGCSAIRLRNVLEEYRQPL